MPSIKEDDGEMNMTNDFVDINQVTEDGGGGPATLSAAPIMGTQSYKGKLHG